MCPRHGDVTHRLISKLKQEQTTPLNLITSINSLYNVETLHYSWSCDVLSLCKWRRGRHQSVLLGQSVSHDFGSTRCCLQSLTPHITCVKRVQVQEGLPAAWCCNDSERGFTLMFAWIFNCSVLSSLHCFESVDDQMRSVWWSPLMLNWLYISSVAV